MAEFGIAIHGGAGTVSKTKITKWKAQAYEEVLRRAYTVGYLTLQKGGRALDAVTEAILVLEDSSLFNAGKGSVFTHKGANEMDASIMNGANLNAGAVAGIQLVKNPILLAKTIMKKSKHVLLTGVDALEFAKEQGLDIESEEYFYDEFRYQQWQKALAKDTVTLDHDSEAGDKKLGTVGAVALDKKGNLAAGTSTGGMVNKKYGRIGDSALIGSGTYANNETCAISCTGHGEYFIRNVVAHDVAARMQYKGISLEEASDELVHGVLKKAGGRGGLVGIDRQCNIVTPFNTKGMYRGYKKSNGVEFAGIYQ